MTLSDYAFTFAFLLAIGSAFLLVSEAPESLARFTTWTCRTVAVVAYLCALWCLVRAFGI